MCLKEKCLAQVEERGMQGRHGKREETLLELTAEKTQWLVVSKQISKTSSV